MASVTQSFDSGVGAVVTTGGAGGVMVPTGAGGVVVRAGAGGSTGNSSPGTKSVGGVVCTGVVSLGTGAGVSPGPAVGVSLAAGPTGPAAAVVTVSSGRPDFASAERNRVVAVAADDRTANEYVPG